MPKFILTYPFDKGPVRDVALNSRLLAENPDFGLSTSERIAGAFVNGRLDLLPDRYPDYREALIRLGREWSHAAIDVIFEHQRREMELSPDHPDCPVGDQRIYFKD